MMGAEYGPSLDVGGVYSLDGDGSVGMLSATMAKPRKEKRPERGEAYPESIDVFSRMEGELVRKLDELAEDQRRSRSSMVAWLVERHVDEEYPKLQAKRKAAE